MGEAVISADAHGVGSVIGRDRILVSGERAPSAGIDVPEVINPVTREQVATIRAGTAADAGLAWASRAPVSRVRSLPKAEFSDSGGDP